MSECISLVSKTRAPPPMLSLSLHPYLLARMVIAYHIISYRIISYHIISNQIISCHITSYHIISYHIMSYHIISYHIISSRIVFYQSSHRIQKQKRNLFINLKMSLFIRFACINWLHTCSETYFALLLVAMGAFLYLATDAVKYENACIFIQYQRSCASSKLVHSYICYV